MPPLQAGQAWHTRRVADAPRLTVAPRLKDYFTPEVVEAFGRRVVAVWPDFDAPRFVSDVLDRGWDDLAFTRRSERIGDTFWDVLGVEVEQALDVIASMLPEELDDPEGALNNGFWMWPLGHVIATHATEHLELGLDACEALTKRFTAEFAVRPFLARYPEAMDRVDRWALDPSEHVRRLASEGTRSRLPWASRLSLPVDRVLHVLTTLRRDDSLYVRRSVANHLNDLAKDDSDRIVSLLEDWHAEGVPETTWIVRHALRNHLKNGDRRVMALFGYEPPEVDLRGLAVSPSTVAIGESVDIAFDLVETAGTSQRLMIDLVVGYRKSNGSIGPKVFKFRDIEIASGTTTTFEKRLGMIVRSTRRLHPGIHSVGVRVNGLDLAQAEFELTD